MGKGLRRALMTTGSTVAVLALAVGQANAHFCFKESLNEKAEQGMNNSNGWVSFGELAAEFTGLCDAGIEILAEAGGVTVTTPIHAHAVMAGGTLKKENGGNKAISHLDFEAIDAAFPAAIAACAEE